MNDSSFTRGPGSDYAQTLYRAVCEAEVVLKTTRLNYQQSAAVLRNVDEPLNLNGVVAIRRAARDYATAVKGYSAAMMAWLRHVDATLPPARKSRWKTTAV